MAEVATEWKRTKDTVRRFTGIGVLRGGPDAGTVAEHAHCEAEVSVHFRPNHAGGRMVAEHTHLYASNQPHSGGWKKGHKVIVFLLSPELLEGAADELSRRGRFEITPVRYLRDRIFEGMGRIVLDEYRTPDQLSALYMESIGNVLAGYIARNYTETRPGVVPQKALSDAELRIIRRFIEERMEAGFSVAEVAGAVGLRPQQFARRLYLTAGLSPWQYVERHRLTIAKLMLRNRRIPLADIAYRLGFVDQSHFTNVFRRMSGVTPSVYRQEL